MANHRDSGKIIFDINDTIEQGVRDELLLPLRTNREDESSGGFYSPYNRSIYQAASPEALDELKEAFSKLEAEYIEIQKDESNPNKPIKTHKNIPVFLPPTVSSITIRKNIAHKGFDIDPDSEDWLCLYSARLEGRFDSKEELEFELSRQHDDIKDFANKINQQTGGVLQLHVETEFKTSRLLVSHQNFWSYAQSLGHPFSRIRTRWVSGSHYRAQLHYLDRDPTEDRWGVMILPPDAALSRDNIHFPLPRKPRRGSLNDPDKAHQVKKIGELAPQVEIYLVK
jgi:hypothetical protein